MRAKKKTKMLIFQDMVRHLQHAIATPDYDAGGWLPSAQTLADEQGASRLTCLKAMRFLQNEGLVRSVPPRGFFVTPRQMRHRKIGIIYANGQSSPFFRQGLASEETRQNCDMSAAIDHISQHGHYAQLIQASRPDQLAAIADSYGLVGVLWFFPDQAYQAAVQDLLGLRIPALLVNPEPAEAWSGALSVHYDFDAIRRARVQFLLARGHRNLLYIGSHASAVKNGVEAAVRRLGGVFTRRHCLEHLHQTNEKLAPLIQTLAITAILSAVSEEENAFLRQALCKIPFDQQPETLMWDLDNLPKMGDDFQPVRTVQMNRQVTSLPGLVAARQLIRHLTTGDPLQSVCIGYAATEPREKNAL